MRVESLGTGAMTPVIIILIIAAVIAIGAYQLLINKYYWGPKGPPKKENEKRGPR